MEKNQPGKNSISGLNINFLLMEYYYIGLFSMLILMLISRNLIVNASNKLPDDKKLLLFGTFKKENYLISIISITLIALLLLNNYFEIINLVIGIIIFFTLEISLLILSFFIKRKKLLGLEFPDIFIKKFVIASLIQISGFIILFVNVLILLYA